MLSWRKDFDWSWTGVTVKETGARIDFEGELFRDIFNWFQYYLSELWRNIGKPIAFHVKVEPLNLRPWYLWWGVIRRAGGQFTHSADKADIALHFEDLAEVNPVKPNGPDIFLNYNCRDITKGHLARVFEAVFGYALSVNPTTQSGDMVKKSELNGKHDGSIITGPVPPEKGWVYQKVINNKTENGTVEDLRCPTIKGQIPLVYIKERPIDNRFDNFNSRCRLSTPELHFNEVERGLISQFCQEMRLDFGGLDILRDRESGLLYIVDVNKTDMGPPLALPLTDKLKSVDILAKAFKDALGV